MEAYVQGYSCIILLYYKRVMYITDLLHVLIDLGTHTCGGYPGTLGYIEQDAKIFASWGVDMLKLDGCYASAEIYETGYPNMTKALNATGRPIVFSCSWPAYISNVSTLETKSIHLLCMCFTVHLCERGFIS